MYYNDNSKRRKINRRTKINKTRFILFSTSLILVLTFVFIKFFLPGLNANLTGHANGMNNETEAIWVENKEDTIRPKKEESQNVSEEKVETETEDKSDKETQENVVVDENNAPGEYDFNMDSVVGPLIYFNQMDSRWNDELYGPQDPIGTHGCGPAVMATIVSSLTDQYMNPKEMSDWSYNNGYCSVGAGSSHALIPEAAKAFGLNVEPLYHATKDDIVNALSGGKIVVVLSGYGIFSPDDGHFFIIRDLKPNGKVTISDSVKTEHVYMQWDIETIIEESSHITSAGGPFWAISK